MDGIPWGLSLPSALFMKEPPGQLPLSPGGSYPVENKVEGTMSHSPSA